MTPTQTQVGVPQISPPSLNLAALAAATGRFLHAEHPPFDDGSVAPETQKDFIDGYIIDRSGK